MEKRQFKRFNASGSHLMGRLNDDDLVDIVNMSVGGLALHANRRLGVGEEFTVRLYGPANRLDVPGVIVRSHMVDLKEMPRGQVVPVYEAAMKFRGEVEERMTDFICDAVLVS